MTSFIRPWAHPAYAEDQPYSHSILTFHVIRSGATLGSIVAAATGTISTLYFGPRNLSTLWTRLLIHSSRGLVYGSLFGALAVTGRMWGGEEIEWKDRSWRLLENRGQMEVDDWVLVGSGLGALAAVWAARSRGLPVGLQQRVTTAVLGAAGVGMTGGTVGYMVWRYGANGGKFSEFKKSGKESGS